MIYKPYEHQTIALSRALQHDSYALFMETGTGKTYVALELIKERKCPTLVVCPKAVIRGSWQEAIRKFAPSLIFCNLWKELKRKSEIPTADIYAINFESVHKIPKAFLSRLNFLIVDESSKMKNPGAMVTKRLLKLSEKIKYKLIMSGTPAPNNELEYWAQMKFVNPTLLGANYYLFRNRNFFSYGYGGYLWAPKKSFLTSLPHLLSKQSYSVKKKNCLDLPEQVFVERKFEMQTMQRSMYNKMLQDNIARIGDSTVLGSNVLAQIMKLRQITSGFAVDTNGKAISVSKSKLELLCDTLEEVGNSQAIIWCQFHWEIKIIKEILGDKACVRYGVGSETEKEQAEDDFKSGKKQFIIAHPLSIGHGLNFTNCHYVIYYSLSYSYEQQKQSEDRVHRIGQTNKVTYFFLLAEKSIDEVIFRAVRKKEKMSDAILEMINE